MQLAEAIRMAEDCGAHITTDKDRPGAPSAGTMVVFRQATFELFVAQLLAEKGAEREAATN